MATSAQLTSVTLLATLFFFQSLSGSDSATTLTITNKYRNSVWPAILPSAGNSTTGFRPSTRGVQHRPSCGPHLVWATMGPHSLLSRLWGCAKDLNAACPTQLKVLKDRKGVACRHAHVYGYDHGSLTCDSADYTITFCPHILHNHKI